MNCLPDMKKGYLRAPVADLPGRSERHLTRGESKRQAVFEGKRALSYRDFGGVVLLRTCEGEVTVQSGISLIQL